MTFDCDVRIVDGIMGSGKTEAAIRFINESPEDEKFLFITPYLSEVERIKKSCPVKDFKEPFLSKGRKLEGIRELINKEENIVSTHELFRRFDLGLIDLCRTKNYTLIMDEVADVIEPFDLSESDFSILKENFVTVDEETGFMKWNYERGDYNGKFTREKNLCELNSLAVYGGKVMMWLFPVEIFNAFNRIVIMS